MTEKFHFICLESKNKKVTQSINSTLSKLGPIKWLKFIPVSLKRYPETSTRAITAFETSKRNPKSRLMRAAKIALLQMWYNGSRSFFERNRDIVAVAWNGLKNKRRMMMDGARDAGARTLYFELSPFSDRITIDPCGINYANGLPRDIEPYLNWFRTTGEKKANWRSVRDTIQARKPITPRPQTSNNRSLTESFVFVPLQVPGDSQLRIFGGAFRTVEDTVEAVMAAAQALPDGWHVRLKEHPTSPISFEDLFARHAHPKVVVDNATDTFTQVAASRMVVTVNSSVGLEAMFFDKPVVALGDCFWAIPGVAVHCPTTSELRHLFSAPEKISYDPDARDAFLSFLIEVYYPSLPQDNESMADEELEKVRARLNGPDSYGFWACSVQQR